MSRRLAKQMQKYIRVVSEARKLLICKQHLFITFFILAAFYKALPVFAQLPTAENIATLTTFPAACPKRVVSDALGRLPHMPGLLIELGAMVLPDGRPGPSIIQRSRLTAQLFLAIRTYSGQTTPVLVSGGGGEAEAMRALLITYGVPENVIYLERHSRNTLQNARNSVQILRNLTQGPTLDSLSHALIVTTKVLTPTGVDHHGRRGFFAFRRYLSRARAITLADSAPPLFLSSFTCNRTNNPLLTPSLVMGHTSRIPVEFSWARRHHRLWLANRL